MGPEATGQLATAVHVSAGNASRDATIGRATRRGRLVATVAVGLLIVTGLPVHATGSGTPAETDPVSETGTAPATDPAITETTSPQDPPVPGSGPGSGSEEPADAEEPPAPVDEGAPTGGTTTDPLPHVSEDAPPPAPHAEDPPDAAADAAHDGEVSVPGDDDPVAEDDEQAATSHGGTVAADATSAQPDDVAAEPASDDETGAAADDEGDDASADAASTGATDEQENGDAQPGATGTATLVRTGNALAVGNLGENEVIQVIEVLVVDGGTVRIEQIAIIVSVGSARSHTGDNVVAGASATTSGAATVITGDAIAIGNAAFTDIDQRVALQGGPGQTITAEQLAHIEHTGYAFASSGTNQAIAGGTGAAGASVTTTGNAYALGNLSEVSILQGGTATASGSAWVSSDQVASVVNRGLAVADTGGNVAVGGTGAGGLETGAAIAEGSVSVNHITQYASAVASGGATVEMRQGALVLNLGVAIARSGGNGLETTGGHATDTGADHEPSLETFAGFEEALLSIVLADGADLAGIGAVLQRLLSAALDEPVELWSHYSDETTTSWTDADNDTVVEMIQRALVFDLGWAWVDSGGNVLVEGGHDLAASDRLRDQALAEVRTGHAIAIGNLSLAQVCQRIGVNADPPAPPCVPEVETPRPRPTPPTEPTLQEATPEDAEAAPRLPEPTPEEPSEVLDAVTSPGEPEAPVVAPVAAVEPVRVQAPTATLARTGVEATTMGASGLLLALLGAWLLARVGRTELREDRRTAR